MFSRGKKSSVKKSTVIEETPLYVQFLPFAKKMEEKNQVRAALLFTFLMGFSVIGLGLWRLSAIT